VRTHVKKYPQGEMLPLEKPHCRDLDVDGRIILRWIFRKWEGVVMTGWSWLRIDRKSVV
jgi:hypothetical protein